MTKTEEVLINKQQKELDRAMEDRKSKRALAGSLGSAAIKSAGPILGAMIKGNTPEWYKRFVKDLSKFTNLSCAYTTGITQMFHGSDNRWFPGIAVFKWINTIGACDQDDRYGETFAINTAMDRTKAQMRSLNSRMEGYEAVDIYKEFQGAVLMNQMEKHLAVALQAYYLRDGMNGYLDGTTLIHALGFSINDFTDNIVKYRELYEDIHATNSKEVALPQGLAYFERKLYCTANVVRENESGRSGIYVMIPRNYPGIATLNNQTGFVQSEEQTSTAETKALVCSNMTFAAFKARYNLYKRVFIKDVSFSSLLADIRAAFTLEKLVHQEWVDVTDPLVIPFIPETVEQLRNAIIPLVPSNLLTHTDIYVSSRGYLCQADKNDIAGIEAGSDFPGINYLGNTEEEPLSRESVNGQTGRLGIYSVWFDRDPDSDLVLESTRFVVAGNSTQTDEAESSFVCGTEVITNLEICYMPGRAGQTPMYITLNGMYSYSAPPLGSNVVRFIEAVKQFYSLPAFDFRIKYTTGSQTVDTYFTAADGNLVALPSAAEIRAIHDQCIKSLMYIDASEFRHAG